MARRKPAARCVVCEKTLDEIGGVRLVATHRHSIRLCDPHTPIGGIRHPARTIRLTGDHRDVIFSMFGQAIWTDEVVERVIEVGMSGFRPWFLSAMREQSFVPTLSVAFDDGADVGLSRRQWKIYPFSVHVGLRSGLPEFRLPEF